MHNMILIKKLSKKKLNKSMLQNIKKQAEGLRGNDKTWNDKFGGETKNSEGKLWERGVLWERDDALTIGGTFREGGPSRLWAVHVNLVFR